MTKPHILMLPFAASIVSVEGLFTMARLVNLGALCPAFMQAALGPHLTFALLCLVCPFLSKIATPIKCSQLFEKPTEHPQGTRRHVGQIMMTML